MLIKDSMVIFAVFLLVLTGCDIDRYIGYQTKGQELIEHATIVGHLTNKFTDEPVYGAHVIIEGLETYSGSNGDFKLIYPLTEDVNRTKPVDITISVENYFQFYTQKQIFPDFNEFDFSLTYAAPIIIDVAKVLDNKNFPFYYCQAIIRDYQGLGNIKRVTGIFPYAVGVNGESSLRHNLTLLEVDPFNSNTGHFQCMIPIENPYEDYFIIEVEDYDGFKDRIQHAVDEANDSDIFLFGPF